MGTIYFFDKHVKKHLMKGTKAVNPSNSGVFPNGVSCIREDDVNMWFYTKEGIAVAFDSGHRDFPGLEKEFRKIGINPKDIKNVFITHVDVDHAGGVDKNGNNIFPNAQIYIGRDEEQYITGKMHRMTKLGFVKLNVGVSLNHGYNLLSDGQVIDVDGVRIEAIHVPGHTLGHMCYIVDDSVLISGDCLAINQNGGYPFFDFFTQFPDMNKKSLVKLRDRLKGKPVKAVCTGHSGYRDYGASTFAHIDETAVFDRKIHFDESAPEDYTKY